MSQNKEVAPTPAASTSPTPLEITKEGGWDLPPLPAKRDYERQKITVGGRDVAVLSAYIPFKLERFKEPYEALGLSRWGRLASVTEYSRLDKKPYCYRLAAETDWTSANDRIGALMIVSISDADGDGIFETLTGGHCEVPDWVK